MLIFIKLFRESLLFAYSSVLANKLRTFLSLLGITIGIFAIISVFTIVDSLEGNIRESLASLGDDVVYIQKFPWDFDPDYEWWTYMRRPVPDLRDYQGIVRRSRTASAVVFSVSTSASLTADGNTADRVGIWANSHDFDQVRHLGLERGRYFTRFESETGRNVAIIGHEIAEQLYPGRDPVGMTFRLRGRPVTVIGVAEPEGTDLFGGDSIDEIVLLPLNFTRNIYNIRSDRLNPMIMVKAKPGIPNQELVDELRTIIRSVRRLKPAENDDFALNQATLITQNVIEPIFSMINLGGWIIGGFSILVGGFGIANIMFVSVKERTKIIGIQKALGAKNYFILLQFLYESVLLAIAGGFLGLLLIFTGTQVISNLTDFSINLTLGNILLGMTVSAIIGVVSGYAPAYSASRLNPVEAITTTF